MASRAWKLVAVLLLGTSGCMWVKKANSSGRPEAAPAAESKGPAPAAQTPGELCPMQGATGMYAC